MIRTNKIQIILKVSMKNSEIVYSSSLSLKIDLLIIFRGNVQSTFTFQKLFDLIKRMIIIVSSKNPK